MSKTSRRRLRQSRPKPARDEPLAAAKTGLRNAVYDLIGDRPEYLAGSIRTLDSRYTQLRDSLYGSRGAGGHHSQPSSLLPCWADALKLLGYIDRRAARFEHCWPPRCANCPHWRYLTARHVEHPTVRRYRQVLLQPWRPQDASTLQTIAAIVAGYAKAVDDLFAPKPVYLRGERCPRCGQRDTRVKTDDGQTVTRPALMVTGEGITLCNACHDVFPSLEFLGDLLRCAR
ncbi:MAG TPA: hypothetical protein VME67_19570 [Mycobacterium sp.]|nr:hypothetical protein [Mycobacterium sp.]HTX96856.1 hypothetical protein [Mycobacterium sp.]